MPVSLKKLAYLDRNWLENFVSNSDLVDLKTAQPIEVDGKISKPENISAADGTVVGTLIGSPLFNTSFGKNQIIVPLKCISLCHYYYDGFVVYRDRNWSGHVSIIKYC